MMKIISEPETEPTMLNGVLTDGTNIAHKRMRASALRVMATYSPYDVAELGICFPCRTRRYKEHKHERKGQRAMGQVNRRANAIQN